MTAQDGGGFEGDLATRSLIPFFAMTFGIAWGLFALMALFPGWVTTSFGPLSGHHPLFILAVYAPAIAAFALVLHRAGLRGLARYLTRLFLWRAGAPWWLLLLLGIPLIYIASAALQGTLSSALPFDSPGSALAAIGFMLILGPIEEFGWRGLALPVLQRRLAPFWASLVLGLVWGLWHMPAFVLAGTPQSAWDFSPFVLGAMAISVILTPLFNTSGGSLALAMLFHFQLNNPLWPDAQPLDSVVFAGVAAIVTVLNRKTLFGRAGAVTRVIPASL
ncbi:CPBP family intramembrane glutamic endopeptidase [Phenylobacterium sp.]|uniref:CPBP family intramembrane glutamic endopeptidase n=1 Tax=Phenylobacterium sp. TaxID=1871053 RepID=UPI00261CA3F2|nr:CPBP family intramembrane glutamic endopeptidase [Phenylobacterium sp.]